MPPKCRARDRAERLVRALHDSLRADVDPRARRHLAVHHQPAPLELAEVLPGRPAARRDCSSRSARAARTRCVRNTPTGLPLCTSSVSSFSSVAQRRDDRVERLPVARRASRAAVHDEIVRPLGDVGIEVVHQHAQRGFLLPSLAGDARCRAARERARAARVRRGMRGRVMRRASTLERTARARSRRRVARCRRDKHAVRARAARRARARRRCARATPRPGSSGAR